MTTAPSALILQSPERPRLDLRRDSLFLDLDGTLAPLAATPMGVGVDQRRNQLLTRLSLGLGGRLAVISGRSIADVDRILAGTVSAVAGVHGLERRSSEGRLHAVEAHPSLGAARAALLDFAATDPGLLIEDKPASIALHYRGAPACRDQALALAESLAARTGLRPQRGACVVELRTPGPDKGDAVAAFLAEPPFAGHRPVFVGDDVTDEDAFAFVEGAGGLGVMVGPPRPTAASARLADVAAVLAWLEELSRP